MLVRTYYARTLFLFFPMKVSISTALFLLFSVPLFAQAGPAPPDPAGADPTRVVQRGASLHVMPLSFFNGFSRFRAGAQYKWSRWGLLLDYERGSDYTQSLVSNNDNASYKFVGIRPELRFDPVPSFTPFYLGMEVPVTKMERRVNGRFTRADGSGVRVTNALQERTRVSLIFKAGMQYAVWNRLYFDLYLGLGAAYRRLEYSDASRTEPIRDDDFEGFGIFGSGLSREGVVYVPELALGLRVGYWLGKR